MKAFLNTEVKFSSLPIVPPFIKENEEKKYTMVDLEMASVQNNDADAEQKQFFDNHKLLQGNISVQSFINNFIVLGTKNLPNVVAVVGNAGSGKTSILQTILRHPELKKMYEHVFFLQCQHVDFDVETNLLQLLATTLPYQWIQDKEVCENVVQDLEKSEQVLILIDDFSQVLATLPPQDSAAMPPHNKENANSLVQGILSRRLLPNARVVITASTHSFFNLNQPLPSFPIFKISKLSDELRRNICVNVCGEKAKSVLDYITSSPDLLSFCNIAENCAAVMHVIGSFMKQQNNDLTSGANLPLTRVAIAAYALILQSKHVRPKNEVLIELAALAWRKFKFNEEVFSLTEKKFFTESHFDSISTIMDVQPESNLKCVQNFHVLWRDILIAIHCNFFMELPEFQDYLESGFKRFGKKLERFTSLYLNELCHKTTLRYLRKLLPSCKIHSEKLGLIQKYVEEKG